MMLVWVKHIGRILPSTLIADSGSTIEIYVAQSADAKASGALTRMVLVQLVSLTLGRVL
jgi:hypothetical protein